MSTENKECDAIKEDSGQHTNGDMVLMIGMFAVMPLLGIGLLGQSLIAIAQGGLLVSLSLLALTLGLGGLALSFSKVKNGFQVGVVLITVAATLSFLFESIAIVPDSSHSMPMIVTGLVVALLLALFDFIIKYGDNSTLTTEE